MTASPDTASTPLRIELDAGDSISAVYSLGSGLPFPSAADAVYVAGYAAFHWDHMRAEEDVLLPLAKAHLSSEDWALVDRAFLSHTDPLRGAECGDEYQALFKRIVQLTPPPYGLAPRR